MLRIETAWYPCSTNSLAAVSRSSWRVRAAFGVRGGAGGAYSSGTHAGRPSVADPLTLAPVVTGRSDRAGTGGLYRRWRCAPSLVGPASFRCLLPCSAIYCDEI